MQSAHGNTYTNHLEGMFNDIKQSEEAMTIYRDHLRANNKKVPASTPEPPGPGSGLEDRASEGPAYEQ